MVTDKAYLVGIHRYSFRAGKPAEIIGVKIITLKNEKPRLCYHIMFNDGTKDFVSFTDNQNYKIISFEDILDGKIPDVTN